jgi:hypothetical protein
MFEMATEKVFHADDKYVLRLLNVVIHEINSKEGENTTNSTSTRRRTRSQKTSGYLCSKLEIFI